MPNTDASVSRTRMCAFGRVSITWMRSRDDRMGAVKARSRSLASPWAPMERAASDERAGVCNRLPTLLARGEARPLVQRHDDPSRRLEPGPQHVVVDELLQLLADVPEVLDALGELLARELVGRRYRQPGDGVLADGAEKEELEELRAPETEEVGLGVEDPHVGLGDADADLRVVRANLGRARQDREHVGGVLLLRLRRRGLGGLRFPAAALRGHLGHSQAPMGPPRRYSDLGRQYM